MNQPRPIDPHQAVSTPTASIQQPPAWNTAPQPYAQPPKKSSKTWLWVVAVLALVVLVCGGGLVGLFAYIATHDTSAVATNTTTANTKTSPGNTKIALPTNSANSSTTSTNTSTSSAPDGRTNVQDIDLEDWVRDVSVYGNTEFTNGEFFMSSKQKGYYYVLVAPAEYTTDNADVRVTLRNVDNMDSRYGYGLIFHSNPIQTLSKRERRKIRWR